MTIRFILLLLFIPVSLFLAGCGGKHDFKNKNEQLDEIEALMLQKPDTIEILLSRIDTLKLSELEKARTNTLNGLIHSNKGEFQTSILELEKAAASFENLKDEYHLQINKLIRAFVFEQLRLDNNAANLYVECESYFQKNNLKKLKFYASLGVLRMERHLKITKKAKISQIEKDLQELKEPIYNGLFYAALGYVEDTDSLRMMHYEKARDEFEKANYWSRVFGMDLNLLFLKIKRDHTESGQAYYDRFLSQDYNHILNTKQKLKREYGQAYLYALQGRNEEAIEISEKVLADAIRYKESNVEMDCIQLLSVLYNREGDYENAYSMLKKYDVLKDKKMSELKQTQLLALGAHYRYSELDRERLGLKVQIQRIFIIAIIVISFLVLLFSVVWFRLKVNKQQKEILKLENVEIKDQIDQLLSSLEKAENKNDSLIGQVKNMKSQYRDSQEVTELLQALENSQIKAWMEYETIFTKLRPGLIEKLKEAFPQLTATDLKYCMCLYFNMNNSMISKLCDVGVDAVKSGKKRIRDKLELDGASEIYIFLKKFD